MGIRLSWSLLAILVLALFLGAMRGAPAWVEVAAFGLTYFGYLTLTLLVVLTGRRWPGLLGFVLFGLAYFLPVFGIFSPRWINRLPTTEIIKSYATTMAARPIWIKGCKCETVFASGSLQVIVTKPDGSIASETGSIITDGRETDEFAYQGLWPTIGNGNDPFVARVYNQYVESWRRSVTFGHLLMTVLCSLLGMVVGIGLDKYLDQQR